jgi:hypothetical protein
MKKLRVLFKKNLPKGFKEQMSYGMIGYVVPHSIYPKGYHCDPKLPLPFINVASQKNFIAVYHMGCYGNPKLLKWFQDEYKKFSPKKKLDMGKSCMRYKKPEDIPYELLAELARKVSPQEYIEHVEKTFEAARKK